MTNKRTREWDVYDVITHKLRRRNSAAFNVYMTAFVHKARYRCSTDAMKQTIGRFPSYLWRHLIDRHVGIRCLVYGSNCLRIRVLNNLKMNSESGLQMWDSLPSCQGQKVLPRDPKARVWEGKVLTWVLGKLGKAMLWGLVDEIPQRLKPFHCVHDNYDRL